VKMNTDFRIVLCGLLEKMWNIYCDGAEGVKVGENIRNPLWKGYTWN
jgi:hypothetical protein